jgi:hypothetical protein
MEDQVRTLTYLRIETSYVPLMKKLEAENLMIPSHQGGTVLLLMKFDFRLGFADIL